MNETTLNAEILTFKENYIVTKSNQLIMKASYELSVEEQRIVLLLISKIQPTDKEFKKYILKVTDYMKIMNNTDKRLYFEMKKAITKLMERLVYIDIEGKDEPLICHWISTTQPDKHSGEFEISICNELHDYLLNLIPEKSTRQDDNLKLLELQKSTKKIDKKVIPYTSYKYNVAKTLQSKYAYRLYEMLKCNEFKSKFTMPIDEFKRLLLIEGKAYESYSNINNRILKICLKEINTKTDIYFEVNPNKSGKKVVGLIFDIKKREINN